MPPDQEEAVDEAFLLQLQEVSHSQALVLMGDFKHPDICWDSGMVVADNPGDSWSLLRTNSWSR